MKNNQLDVVWVIIGTQSLYGQKTLNDIALQAEKVVSYLNQQSNGSIKLQLKPLAKQTDEITTLCQQANADEHCLGIVVWLHTFSPAKMWINGLSQLQKPLLQLHTQYNEAIPWETIDMDYMNLNQTAHGGREFGFIGARMRQFHCVVVGHWQHKETRAKLNKWIRVCQGIHEEKRLKIARFGDNMREVAVTEGNKVNAQIQFGYSVNGYSLNELESEIRAVAKGDVTALIDEYENSYCFTERTKINGSQRSHVVDAAKIELGIKHFLEKGGFGGFTTTFENLAGLTQLPGLAVQRLMQQGYGFGAEGDWKTAALLRTMKIMDHGLTGGTSFMEDYTYHLVKNEQLVVGAHMLEVCPSISAQDKPLLDVQPLGIGGKADPARLIFTAKPGPAINVSLIDLGNRFRLIINKVNNIKPPHAMPKLPVACALWQPEPDLDIAVQAWVLAGGAHHSVHSLSLDSEMMQLYANIHGIESILIDEKTEIHNLRNELRWNESSFLHSL